MGFIGKSGLVLMVWLMFVFAQSYTVDQLVDWTPALTSPSDATGAQWVLFDLSDAQNNATWAWQWAGNITIAVTPEQLLWSAELGNHFPTTPVVGDEMTMLGSIDTAYQHDPDTYANNPNHTGFYWMYTDTMDDPNVTHWGTTTVPALHDTLRPMPIPSVVQDIPDSVEVRIMNPYETVGAFPDYYSVLGFDLWCDTSGTGSPISFDVHIGFFPTDDDTPGHHTLIKYCPRHFVPPGVYQTYHAYYLVAKPQFPDEQEEPGHMTFYLSGNSNEAEILRTAKQKDALPACISLNAVPSVTRNRAAVNYALTRTTAVTITVYNISGQVVSILVDEIKAAGEYTVMFDGTEMPGGVYMCQLKTPDAQLNTKLILLE